MATITRQEAGDLPVGPVGAVEVTRRVAPAPAWVTKMGAGFQALRHRNYRLFFFGQLVSLVGTWMQTVAQSWLVLSLAGKDADLMLGLTSALQFAPVLFLSVFGGALADRLPKRNVLLVTQSTMAVLALVLGFLTTTGLVQIWHVLVLAGLLGVANAIDMPARQSFIVELVGKEDLMNSIALNSSVFNAARVIGPGVAGLLIHLAGVDGCFYLNGISFVAVLTGLALMRPPFFSNPGAKKEHNTSMAEGFRYIARTPAVLALVALVGVVGTFGMNFSVWMPVLAQDDLGVGASGYGAMMSAMGVGALAAGLALAYRSKRGAVRRVFASAAGFCALLVALAGVRFFPLTLLLMAVLGVTMVLFSATANTTVQLRVPDELRGRVMAVYMMVFAGTTPIGALMAGTLAHFTSTPVSMAAGGGVSLLALLALWFTNRAHTASEPA